MSIVPYLVVLSTGFIIKDWRCGNDNVYCCKYQKDCVRKNLTVKKLVKNQGRENAIYRWDKQNPNLSSLKKFPTI